MIHILTKESQYTYTCCGKVPHINMVWWGDIRDATCKICYPNARKDIEDREYAAI